MVLLYKFKIVGQAENWSNIGCIKFKSIKNV